MESGDIVLGGAVVHGVHVVTYLKCELADSVVSQYLLLCESDLKRSKSVTACVRPVLVALGPASLLQISNHHNGGRPLLPHHPPEIHHSVGKRSCINMYYYNTILSNFCIKPCVAMKVSFFEAPCKHNEAH